MDEYKEMLKEYQKQKILNSFVNYKSIEEMNIDLIKQNKNKIKKKLLSDFKKFKL